MTGASGQFTPLNATIENNPTDPGKILAFPDFDSTGNDYNEFNAIYLY